MFELLGGKFSYFANVAGFYIANGDNVDNQICTPCEAGEQCLDQSCTQCSPCPAGTFKAGKGTQGCVQCDQGKYNPFQGKTSGGDCTSCPAGSITSGAGKTSQEDCGCLKEFYTTGDASQGSMKCNVCPAGAMCNADRSCALSDGPVGMSCDDGQKIYGNWTNDASTGLYSITSCPSGFFIASPDKIDNQACEACNPGQECTLKSCLTCTMCPKGAFKAIKGAEPCSLCESGKYNGKTGASSFADCALCPSGASTKGLSGRISLSDCFCSSLLYSIREKSPGGETEDLKCKTCPQGAKCRDGSCGLSDEGCQGVESITGQWIRKPNLEYALLGCPVGHTLRNATHDFAECLACPEGKYVFDSSDPEGVCVKCPPGAECPGGGPPIFDVEKTEVSIPFSGDLADMDTFIEELAKQLGVEPHQIQIPEARRRRKMYENKRRNGGQMLTIIISTDTSSPAPTDLSVFKSPDFMDKLSTSLAAKNVTVELKPATVVVAPAVEVPAGDWELVDGVFQIRGCPVGSLLINATLEASECKRCEPMTYSVDPLDGCESGVCNLRFNPQTLNTKFQSLIINSYC